MSLAGSDVEVYKGDATPASFLRDVCLPYTQGPCSIHGEGKRISGN